MVTTKKTSFPSLHSDQGHGLTKVWSKQNKSQNYKRKKEGLNASKSLGERRWEEGGLLEEGFNSQSVDISPKIIFTPKYVRFVINCCESHLRTFCRFWRRGDQANLGNARILRAFGKATPPLVVQRSAEKTRNPPKRALKNAGCQFWEIL